jgi:hypothetical protein
VKYGQPTFYAFLYYAHKVVYLREPITVWAINSEKLKILREKLRIDIVYKCNMLQFISKLSGLINYIYCIETLTTNVPNFVAKFGTFCEIDCNMSSKNTPKKFAKPKLSRTIC